MLVSDKWGTRPLFYIFQEQKLIASENIDELLQKLAKATLNAKGVERFLIQDFSHPTETLFQEIKKVRPGHQVFVQNQKIQEQKISDIDFAYHSNTKEELSKKWSIQIRKNLLKILQTNKKCGIFVSGGLDSSGLVALCNDLILSEKLDCKLELYHAKTNHSESDDHGFVQKISQQLNLPLYTTLVTPESLALDFLTWKGTTSAVPFFPTLQMFSPLLKKAGENSCQTILFGYGMDEQWTLSLSLLSHFKYQIKKNLPKQIHWFWRPSTKRDLDFRIDEVDHLFSNLTQKQLYLRNYFSGNNTYNLACHIALAAPYGLEVRFPYLCPELLDLSFSTEPNLFSQLQDKYLLRQTLKGLLDDSIRLAPKFQDYSYLAYNTALQIKKESQEYLSKPFHAVFDDDSFFEVCFIDKISKQYKGGHHEKTRFY